MERKKIILTKSFGIYDGSYNYSLSIEQGQLTPDSCTKGFGASNLQGLVDKCAELGAIFREIDSITTTDEPSRGEFGGKGVYGPLTREELAEFIRLCQEKIISTHKDTNPFYTIYQLGNK